MCSTEAIHELGGEILDFISEKQPSTEVASLACLYVAGLLGMHCGLKSDAASNLLHEILDGRSESEFIH